MKFNKIIFILMIAATIIFAGMIGSSYAYYKDSLKVIDLILRANGAVQRDLDILRSLDICDRIDTSK